MRSFMTALVLGFLFTCSMPPGVGAFETDQYNLSQVPLGDIGDEVSGYVEERLRWAIANLNGEISKLAAEIAERELCVREGRRWCKSVETLKTRLVHLRSEAGVVEFVFRALGGGTSTRSDIGRWFARHNFRVQPDRFKPSYGESIYRLNLGDFLTQSPTINMWGVEFGFDKIEHFFQEGHKYYKIASRARARGLSDEQAVRKAIEWGRFSERTFYGYWTSGVYSQADLFANYAGMKFYERLTRFVTIAGREYAPMLKLVDGVWSSAAGTIREDLLKLLISEHLNEALNPSAYRLTLIRSIRRNVRKFACAEWRTRFPNATEVEMAARTAELATWGGDDYGFVRKSRVVRLAETCF